MQAAGQALGAVIFDAYGTLFDVHAIARVADELFPNKGVALAAAWREKQLEYARVRSMSGRYADFWSVTADALDYVLDRLGLPAGQDAVDRLLGVYRRLPSHPGDREALVRLKELGLPLAILSNGAPRMLEPAIEAAGFDGLFDLVLTADQVRRFKTAPEIYQLGLDALGLPAKRILFVSSNGWDVCAAAWFGYRTFWMNRAGLPPERLGVSAEAAGRSMDELVRFVATERAAGRGPA
ncbi:haloacid dehalogenase type II [Geminicoccus flavidas]|uniref:haloacid dehalogenase type II n=1 Tax=Geminicoccus flavidas TaxID=2506407 RepID=UPI00135A3993|nr:haloacid dehalogenase type II [Geminicoccus flavidas]